jgi:uncharacterized coiled-coil protein SlyX
MIKNKLFQLAKLILQLASLETTNGVKLIYEGSLEVGTEVFIEEEGELKPAPNAEYVTEDKTIVVKDGKVEAVEEVVPEPTTEEVAQEEAQEEPTQDPKVAELEAQLAEKEATIKELEEKIKALEEELSKQDLKMSVAKPAKEEIKEVVAKNSELKFYQFQ